MRDCSRRDRGVVRPARAVAAVALLAALALAGCTSDGGDDAPWHGRDLAATDPSWTERTIAGGETFEIDFERAAGETITWDWFVEERSEIVFGVHSHRGGATLTLLRIEEVEHVGSIDADRDGVYSLTWSPDAAMSVWFRVAADYTVPENPA